MTSNIFDVKCVLEVILSFEDSIFIEMSISVKEIDYALSESNLDKSPGPYVINAGALKVFWNSIKTNMLECIWDFQDNGYLPCGLKSSFITMIPKVNDPLLVKDFRPISRINCSPKSCLKSSQINYQQ